MDYKLILNILLVAIVVICAWSGYKKGLIMGIGRVIIIIISLFGANLLSNTFSYEVIPVLRPFASGYMEKQMNETVSDDMGITDAGLSVEDYLLKNPDEAEEFCYRSYQALGIYEAEARDLAQQAVEYADEQDVSVREAVTEVLCTGITYASGFILAFLLILIVLTVIGNLPNLSFKIPHLDIVNDIGGTLIGVFTGVMFCAVIAWALQYSGIIFKEEVLTESGPISWFLNWGLLNRYI